MVVGIGAAVLRKRVGSWQLAVGKAESHTDHHHNHHHSHANCQPPTANHHHHHEHDLTTKGIVAMGASAGLIPCPSALVVLLGAIAQHQIALGLLLITMFSLGLAGTLTGLGLAVVYARKLTTRLNVSSRLVTALPAVSALVILGAGCLLTARAVPQLV
jgi:ABC-type nickel/cobalt efflux system permease component RcnA